MISVLIKYSFIADEDLLYFDNSDASFGSFLQDMRKKGVLQAIENSNYATIDTAIKCKNNISSPCNNMTITDILEVELKTKGDTKDMNKFDFGTCEKDNIRMSMYGIAVKNAAGEWVSYDAKTDSIINVDIFNFNGGKYLLKMPVALKDIKKGDVIVHNKIPMYISQIENERIFAVDPIAGEEKCVLLTKNMFGFDFATKIVSLVDMGNSVAPSKDSPFGNMWPLLMADENIDPLMMMAMNNNMNPMMMYLLMNKDSNKDNIGLLMAISMMEKNKEPH